VWLVVGEAAQVAMSDLFRLTAARMVRHTLFPRFRGKPRADGRRVPGTTGFINRNG